MTDTAAVTPAIDLVLLHRRADKEAAETIRRALAALSIAVQADIEPKARGSAKALREAMNRTRAVLVLWPEAILDPTDNHAALYGQARAAHGMAKLIGARLGAFAADKLEPPFDALPAPDVSSLLTAGADAALPAGWLDLLTTLGLKLDRPHLAALATAIAADRGKADDPAQRAFARAHEDDPGAAAIWARFEISAREAFATEFRKAHNVLVERGNAAQDRLRETLQAFPTYLKAARLDPAAPPPDPKLAIVDGVAELRDSVGRLSSDNERLQTALDRLKSAPPPVPANDRLPLRWAGIAAATFLVGAVGATGITEFAGPLRGDAHPRIAAYKSLAEERTQFAAAAPAEIARLREALRVAARKTDTAEANLRVARTHLAHSQTELTQRQTQAGAAAEQSRKLQAELQTLQQAAQASAQASEQRIQEALNRANAAEQELRARETQVAAAPPAPTPRDPDITGSIARPAPASPPPAAPAPAPAETTGSIPPPPPPGPQRHEQGRWSFAMLPGLSLASENDLPGPVNSVLVHEGNRDAVIVISANNARAAGACTPEDWYTENVIEGPRPRRGQVTRDGSLPAGPTGFQGFSVRGRGVVQGERFRNDLEFYDLVVQQRNEPGVVYLIQARFPRAMASEMVRNVNDLWKNFALTGPRAYPTRC